MATLRGVLRSMEASARRAERESLRRQKELIRQQKECEKLQELERAAYEVEVHENRIAVLQSMHQDCSGIVDWQSIKNTNPPETPENNNELENQARKKLENYKPTFFQKLLGKVEKNKESLEQEIIDSRKKDEKNFAESLKEYENEKLEWEENKNIATMVLECNLDGYKSAFKKLNPFSEISDLGTGLSIRFPNKDILLVDLNVHSDEIIPNEIKSLLKSGKLSVKPMPIGTFNEIYQDHICSSILRIARETFAALPLKKVIVTAYSDLLNTQTGNKENTPIVSVLIPEETLNNLNFENIDPSDSMKNFVHNMNFKKNLGFTAVEQINYEKYI